LPNCLQSEHQTLEALQQGVVQLSGDPDPLVEPLFHALLEPPAYPSGDLADPYADQRPHRGRTACHAQNDEPSGLNKGRWNHESKRGAGLVPYAIVAGVVVLWLDAPAVRGEAVG
jgi:hypothetical protein